jgi:hypothetical protein
MLIPSVCDRLAKTQTTGHPANRGINDRSA